MSIEIFQEQDRILHQISKKYYEEIISLYRAIPNGNVFTEECNSFISRLYDTGIIFSFEWPRWEEGHKAIRDPRFEYSSCSLLQISMYLTTIIRGDRFNEGLLSRTIAEGIFDRLMLALEERVGELP